MSPLITQRIDALWLHLSQTMPLIEAVTFHEASPDFPPAWGIAFEGGSVLLVDGQPDPDRLVFSLALGEVPPAVRQETCETVQRVNAWLAMQDDVVGELALSGRHVVLSGQLRVDGLDLHGLRQAVLDIQGAAHAWRYFLQVRHNADDTPREPTVTERWLERA